MATAPVPPAAKATGGQSPGGPAKPGTPATAGTPAKPGRPDRSGAPAPPPKTAAELQAEIAESRERLVVTLAELREQTTPANLARKGVRTVTGFFTDEYGGIRPDRVVLAGAAVLGLVLFRRWRHSRRTCHCH